MLKRVLGFVLGIVSTLGAAFAFFRIRDRMEITEEVNELRAAGRKRNAQAWKAIDKEAEKINAEVEEVGLDRKVLARMLDE